MKIIIDIDKNEYDEIIYFKNTRPLDLNHYDRMIATGTPLSKVLESIKGEIEAYCKVNCPYSEKQRDVMCGACMMGDAIEIIDKYGEEQE